MRDQLPGYFIDTYENTPDKVCILHEDGTVAWINRELYAFVKKEPDYNGACFTGITYMTFLRVHLQEDESIISRISDGIEELKQRREGIFTSEFPMYTGETSFWLMLVACYIKDKYSDKTFVVVRMYDITDHHDRRKLENSKDDNNIVKLIIGESMHTWRQPLNTISLFAQDLKEQFDDNSLTKYYMNFAVKQIQGEIKRLSESIDEMSTFYTNDTKEDTINITEVLFSSINEISGILKRSDIQIKLNCHPLGNVASESFIKISDNFHVRCGTGTKQCFYGCNKGKVIFYGDKVMFSYILKMLMTLCESNYTAAGKNIYVELAIEDDKLTTTILHHCAPGSEADTIRSLKALFDKNFPGKLIATESAGNMQILLTINKYKTKSMV